MARKPKKIRRRCRACTRAGIPIGRLYGLCKTCFGSPAVRKLFLFEFPPAPDEPCPHPPGSQGKIRWMQVRARRGQYLFHQLDRSFEGCRPGAVQPLEWPEVFALPKLRVRGVEKSGKKFLARPMWAGKKYYLGEFQTYDEAAAIARQFWIREMGIFWQLGGNMRFHLLPVRTKEKRQPANRKPKTSEPPTLFDEERPVLKIWQAAG